MYTSRIYNCDREYEDFCQQYTLNILFSATPSTFRRTKLRDLEVSDISVPLSSDSGVIGSGATLLNNNDLDIDVEISGSSDRRHVSPSRSLTHGMNSPATALNSLLSMIEYANKPVLINLATQHNVQLPSEYNIDELRTLIASHLSGGDCIDSKGEDCMQLVTSFCNKSDAPCVFTKLSFQIQILSSILHLIRLRPLR